MARRPTKRRQTRKPDGPAQPAGGEKWACYVNADWREFGEAAVYCLCYRDDGTSALAAFAVDVWCMGLKDAWGEPSVTREQFDLHVLGDEDDINLVRVNVDEARRLVAGGIRFAQTNGFRLPANYQRWVELLGDLGDIAAADLTEFGVGGGLRYIGSPEALERGLIAGTVEEFMARDDVEVEFEDDDADEEGVLEEASALIHERGVDAVRQWCFARGVKPPAMLDEAIDIVLASAMQPEIVDKAMSAPEDAPDLVAAWFDELLADRSPAERATLTNALDLVREFMNSFDSPEALSAHLGLGEE